MWPKKGFRVNTKSHVNWDAIDTIPKIGTHQCWWTRALCEDRIIFRGPKSQGTLSPWRHARRRGAYTIVHNEGRLLHFDNHLTMGGIACAMSHRLALKALVAHPTVAWTNIHGSYVEKGWKEMSCVWLGLWRISSNRTPVKLWDSGAAVGCCLLGNWTFAETNPQVKPIFKSSQLTNFLQHMFLPHPFPPLVFVSPRPNGVWSWKMTSWLWFLMQRRWWPGLLRRCLKIGMRCSWDITMMRGDLIQPSREKLTRRLRWAVGPYRGKFSGETFGGAWFLTRVHRLRPVFYADWPSNTRIMCRLKTVFVCNFESSIWNLVQMVFRSVWFSQQPSASEVPVRPMREPCFGLFAWVVRREAAEDLLSNAFPIGGQARAWMVRGSFLKEMYAGWWFQHVWSIVNTVYNLHFTSYLGYEHVFRLFCCRCAGFVLPSSLANNLNIRSEE